MPTFKWALYEANLDPSIGSEQKGTRPVLVVSNEEYNHIIPNVTVLPLTLTQRNVYPSEVLIAAEKTGQSLKSIIMAHQIITISKKRLTKMLGRLDDPNIQREIQIALKEHLDLV